MEQAGKATELDKPANGSGGIARTGQSGEGARSALEHLIQQERKRDAQRLPDAAPPAPGPGR
jgi:hypothetical protein